ncbi:MAG: hypothetical protein A4E65_01994 [Syntrophorhabdus sp. PtaU1.Bin153]|nr:MAG: hypothetical protein A4E65_01994 [Syntrophorhabdus sp. PtaU1.Bin153]
MKKRMLIVFILTVSVIFATIPGISYSGSYHGHYHGHHGHGYYGWEAAAVVGGSILLGTLIGLAVNSPRYAPPPRAYPEQAYAYPDPSLTNSYPGLRERKTEPGKVYGSQSNSGNPPGVWVNVPGQWVRGTWVPAHKAWAPVNP